jgi:hypothetical protein
VDWADFSVVGTGWSGSRGQRHNAQVGILLVRRYLHLHHASGIAQHYFKKMGGGKYFPAFFLGNVLKFFPCFQSPLADKRPKTHYKKEGTYFFLRAGADLRRFSVLFFLPPLDLGQALQRI